MTEVQELTLCHCSCKVKTGKFLMKARLSEDIKREGTETTWQDSQTVSYATHRSNKTVSVLKSSHIYSQ